ncbi:hypothetical protein [Phytohabitans flavus]|uniref:hypothetical protein n=1 Tax=Phytohabitans flavus TaxID=1076124 RepID=UPI0018D66532|nr:hypothetical protein [Phytohabitans flavus]
MAAYVAMNAADSKTISAYRSSISRVPVARCTSSARWIGCGCCQMRNGPIGLGLSRPSGPTCLGQRAPAQPWRWAVARAPGSTEVYQPRLRSSSSGRPQRAKCAACHQCISRWKRPRQLFTIRPVSCGGSEPAQWMRVRYWESTIRRSSSAARGSVLPDSSTAPPLSQKAAHASTEARTHSSKPAVAPNPTVISSRSWPETSSSCGPVWRTEPPAESATSTVYRVSSRTRSTLHPSPIGYRVDECASGRAQSAATLHDCDPYGNAIRTASPDPSSAETTRTASTSRSGWQAVVTRTGVPRRRNRLSMTPVHRSSRWRTSVTSPGATGCPSRTSPIRPRSSRWGLLRSHDSASEAGASPVPVTAPRMST